MSVFVGFPGAIHVTENARYHQTYGYRQIGHPPACILHTVEGLVGRSYIASHKHPPHLWMDPLGRETFQTISLDRPALALENPPGPPTETNHRGLLFQIELQLYSDPDMRGTPRHVGSLTDAQLQWIGQQLAELDRICRSIDPKGRGFIPETTETVAQLPAGDAGYGYNSSTRMTVNRFEQQGGIWGHAEVPQNSHYDPAELDMKRIVEHALASVEHEPAPMMLRVGSTGESVKSWQRILNYTIDAKLDVDGLFFGVTAAATRKFEAAVGLAQDGAVSVEQFRIGVKVRKEQKAGERPTPLGQPRPEEPATLIDTAAIREQLTSAMTDLGGARARINTALTLTESQGFAK